MNVPDEQLAELVKAAQDAETLWLDQNRRRTGNWSRVTDSQAARYIAAVRDRYEQMCLAKWLKQLPAAAKGHWPSVASRYDGTWGVFCVACSAEAGDYAACKLGRGDWPPDVLADPAQVRAKVAEEIRQPFAMTNAEMEDLRDLPGDEYHEQCGEVYRRCFLRIARGES